MLVIRHKTEPAKEQGQYIKVKRIQDQEIDFLRKRRFPIGLIAIGKRFLL